MGLIVKMTENKFHVDMQRIHYLESNLVGNIDIKEVNFAMFCDQFTQRVINRKGIEYLPSRAFSFRY
jgi:hypothetical protein